MHLPKVSCDLFVARGSEIHILMQLKKKKHLIWFENDKARAG